MYYLYINCIRSTVIIYKYSIINNKTYGIHKNNQIFSLTYLTINNSYAENLNNTSVTKYEIKQFDIDLYKKKNKFTIDDAFNTLNRIIDVDLNKSRLSRSDATLKVSLLHPALIVNFIAHFSDKDEIIKRTCQGSVVKIDDYDNEDKIFPGSIANLKEIYSR